MRWLAGETFEPNQHLHIEYYPNHPFLDPTSDSLVISRVDSI
ncbi:MAG: Imm32 family immunity protein [Pyrinomonadaceae bacterium]